MNAMISNIGKVPSKPFLTQAEEKTQRVKQKPEYYKGSILPRKPKNKQGALQYKPTKGRIIGSVLLSVVVFALVFIFNSTIFVKYVLSEENISTALQKIDYANLKLGSLLSDRNLGLDLNVEEDDATTDIIFAALLKYRVGISRTQLESIMEESAFSEFISKNLAQYFRYVLIKEKTDGITSDAIVLFVERNRRVFEKATGMTITFNDLYEMKYQLDTDYRRILDALSIYKIDKMLSDHNIRRPAITEGMLTAILAVSAVLFAFVIVLIGNLHKKARASLIYAGIPVFLAGAAFYAVMFGIVSIIKGFLEGPGRAFKDIEPIISVFFTKGSILGAVTAGAGLIMLIGFAVMTYNTRKGTSFRDKLLRWGL